LKKEDKCGMIQLLKLKDKKIDPLYAGVMRLKIFNKALDQLTIEINYEDNPTSIYAIVLNRKMALKLATSLISHYFRGL
jgi:hypothetical protein